MQHQRPDIHGHTESIDTMPTGRRKLSRAAPQPLRLEPRLMFDGAAVATTAEVVHEASPVLDTHEADATEVPIILPAVESPTSQVREILFIDPTVADWQTLTGGVRSDVETVVLDPHEDGLKQIAQFLSSHSGLAAIHLVSHGSGGDLILGGRDYTADSLSTYADDLQIIGGALKPGGDILLYGCNIADGVAGTALLNTLAQATGANIAASSDDTGSQAMGGDWVLERSVGSIEASAFADLSSLQTYDGRLATVSLSGANGWTAIMFGVNKDPQGDSQAGAADTDIVGDANHGSLYTAYDDNGTATTADDRLLFRLRIDNPTSASPATFSGVAVVGMDANLDGRIDLFMSVDGRNNTQAVRLLDPGTGANISPNTTTTSPLPAGWLANNGVYSFSSGNFAATTVTAISEPHWNGDNDVGNAGGTDIFISWSVPIADMTTVLAKPSPVDRNGVVGPRGLNGISGFTKDTTVQYVTFTQPQPGPINGDLNGVGGSYDKNATFASLTTFTAPMSASNPVPVSTLVNITDNVAGVATGNITFTFTFSEGVTGFDASDITVNGGTAGAFTTVAPDTYTLVVTPNAGVDNGTAAVSIAAGAAQSISGSLPTAAASAGQAYDTLAPAIGIDQLAGAVTGRPTITGTSDLPDGSLVTINVDTDNNPLTANVIYQVLVSGGAWSLNTASIAPVSGTLPSSGLTSYSKITATATDAAGNSTTATALNRPTVTSLSTNDTTPVITGTWCKTDGDVLTVTVGGATYTLAPSGNTWSIDLGSAVPSSGTLSPLVAGNTYSVTATMTRNGVPVSDTTSSELSVTSAPVVTVDITGGATASGSDTTPSISGSSANAGGFVIVQLAPGNDGDLSDAVTYSVATVVDGSWSLDTGTATPISGTAPSAGYIGAVGIRATNSAGTVADTQVLTISTPTVTIGSITSAAATDAYGSVNNSGAGANYLNITEDNSVAISGTATNGFAVNLTINDASGNSVAANNLTVTGGSWSASGLDLSNLDSGTLTVNATLVGTAISATNTSVTHDKIPNQIFITNQTTIPKTQATISGSSTLGSGVGLTVTIRNSTDMSTIWSGTATTDASGNWSVTTPNGTNLVGANTGNVIIKVAPTSTNTDAAGNITQLVTRNPQAVQNGAANTSDTITIGTIAGDNLITANEIGSGLSLTGTTNLTTAATSAFTITVTDGTVTQTATVVSNVSGTWTATLTQSQVQALHNGELVVTAKVNNTTSGISVSSVALPPLSLATPTLVITDDTPGTATGDVIFTFTFSEAMTGFTASDITVTGGTKGSFSGSGTTYALAVTPTASCFGCIAVSVASGAANGTSTSVVAENKPAGAPLTTNDDTPTIAGTWTNVAGDTLSVTVHGVTYTVGSGLNVSGNAWSLTTGALAAGTYDVVAKVSRSGTEKTDDTSNVLVIATSASVDISGGASISTN